MNRTRLRRENPPVKKRIVVAVFAVFAVIIGVFLIEFAKYIPVFWQLTFNKEITLKKTPQQRVNILLLGIGGGKHEGPNLTDTIIFASIDQASNKVTLVSLPRDFWIPDLGAKINTAYAFGEAKRTGGGLLLAKATISKILNQPIDYGVRVDFNGFVRAVDMVDGLDITVEKSFDDYEYPVVGKENDLCDNKEEDLEKLATAASQLEAFPCRYEHLHFDRGVQHMDGISALKFVRSRHAKGSEGSDFARSKRQEKVILEFREKVFSLNTFLNPVRMISLYDVFKDSIDMDIKQSEYDDFIKLAQKMKNAKIGSYVLDYGDGATQQAGLLTNPPISEDYRGQWVIIPRIGNGNYTEIQKYVECQIKTGNCEITPTDVPS